MTGWLAILAAMAAIAEPPGEVYILSFEADADILTTEGYQAAREAAAAFEALPKGFPYQAYVWISDCRDGPPYDLIWVAQTELMALGITPDRFFRSDTRSELDPCRTAGSTDGSVLVGVGRFEGGPWLTHHDMPLIHFASGSAELDAFQMQKIRWARPYVTDASYIVIEGHADTAEDNPEGLSAARAQAVRDALVRLGVPDWQMRTEPQGVEHLARITPPGTPEPLNRRASLRSFRVNEAERTPAWWFDQRDAAAPR